MLRGEEKTKRFHGFKYKKKNQSIFIDKFF